MPWLALTHAGLAIAVVTVRVKREVRRYRTRWREDRRRVVPASAAKEAAVSGVFSSACGALAGNVVINTAFEGALGAHDVREARNGPEQQKREGPHGTAHKLQM